MEGLLPLGKSLATAGILNCPAMPVRGISRGVPRFVHLQMHLLVALFAVTAVLGRLITLSAPSLVVWRAALAVVGGTFLAAVIFRSKILPPVRQILPLLGIGALVGIHWMCFFGAVKLANISICLAGLATISFFTAFTEPLLERRRVRPLEVWLGLLVLAGILLIAGYERGRLAGLLSALGAAFLAAVFPVLNRRLVRQGRMDPLMMVTWEMLGACLISLVALPFLDGPGAWRGLVSLKGLDWFWLILLAWVCTVFAHGFHIHLLRHLSAYTSNLTINLEPVYGILMAAVLFGEHQRMHPVFFLGAAVIVLANIVHPLVQRRIARDKSP